MEENNGWQEMPNQKKSKSKVGIVIICLIIIILGCAAAGAWYYLNNYISSPKSAFLNNLEKLNKTTEALLEKGLVNTSYVYDEKKALEYGIKLSGKLEANRGSMYEEEVKQINDLLNGEEFYVKEQVDLINREIYAYGELRENNKKAISGEMYIDDNYIVMALKDIIDKNLYVNREEAAEELKEFNEIWESLFNQNNLDNDIYEIVMKVIKANIKDEQFTQSTATININGADVNCDKTSLSIRKEQPKKIIIEILEALRDDEKMQNLFKTYSNNSISQNDPIDELKDLEMEIAINIDLYNNGSDVVKMDINATMYVEDDELTLDMSADFSKNNNIDIVFEIGSKESQVSYSIKLNIEVEENRVFATLDFGSMLDMKVTLESKKTSDSESVLELKVIQSKKEMFALNVNSKTVKNSKDEIEVESSVKLKMTIDEYYGDTISVALDLVLSMANIDRVNAITTGTKDINLINGEMSEADLKKLQDKVTNLKIYKKINDAMGGLFERANTARENSERAMEEEERAMEELLTQMSALQLQAFNSQFESYAGDRVKGTEVKVLITRVNVSNMTYEDDYQKQVWILFNGEYYADDQLNDLLSEIVTSKTYTVSMEYSSYGTIDTIIIEGQ